ncbi:MAG TPA: type II CAAX endopeptidase family protein [Caulobacteraceae bacterium]|nr:type II CAAX endopeptidase family protein [Caulobacteraceae bacterium]
MTTFLDMAARGRTAWWRYLVATVLAVVVWVVAIVAGFVVLILARLDPMRLARGLTAPTDIALFFGGTAVLFGSLLAAFAVAIRLIHGKRFGDITGPWDWRLTGRGAAIWLAACILAGAADYVIEPRGFSFTAGSATLTLALWAIPCLIVQTFTEEFIFRGYVTQGLFLATRRPLVSAVISGLLFAALHIPNGWPQAANAAAFGTVTALIAIRTGSIAFTFGLHVVNNVFGAVILVSANDVFRGVPALFTQATPNLIWLDAAIPLVALFVALAFAGVRPSWATQEVRV